mmetsp:Transcript_4002/g.5833  ORF Transcript_4002/g.5833 Transcript_4002/m.5833 type:complete len:551 (-) Transcript_4002:136-1788(-)
MEIDQDVLNALNKSPTGTSGWLFGIQDNVVAFLVDAQATGADAEIRLPIGIAKVGRFVVGKTAPNEEAATGTVIQVPDGLKGIENLCAKIASEHCLLYLRITFNQGQNLGEQLGNDTAFLLPNGSMYCAGTSCQIKIGECFAQGFQGYSGQSSATRPGNNKKTKLGWSTIEPGSGKTGNHAYSCLGWDVLPLEAFYQAAPQVRNNIQLVQSSTTPSENTLDIVCCAKKTSQVGSILENIRQSMIERIEELVLKQSHILDITCFGNRLVPVTVSYEFNDTLSTAKSDVVRSKQMESAYQKLGINKRLPSLCETCRIQPPAIPGLLRSPHLGPYAKPHAVPKGIEYRITGHFDYYHYGLQGFDDKGWGCAYRSLQMVSSWYQLNGLTSKAPLAIPEIQKTLINMGVMGADFFEGCKSWIGSQEIAWALNSLYNVDCRFLMSSNGVELNKLTNEFARHFETNYCPIVACGGKLALVIIGVVTNPTTGDTKYLIADPHYKGTDTLRSIQTQTVALEGYKAIPVSWRGPSAFAKYSKTTFVLTTLPSGPISSSTG